MTGSELIEKWIEEQVAAGKSQDEIVRNGHFVYGNSYYKLQKSGKKYALKVQIGCIDLASYQPTPAQPVTCTHCMDTRLVSMGPGVRGLMPCRYCSGK